jgi:hypothetical protein
MESNVALEKCGVRIGSGWNWLRTAFSGGFIISYVELSGSNISKNSGVFSVD